MKLSRRDFVVGGAAIGAAVAQHEVEAGMTLGPAKRPHAAPPGDRFDPWIELDPAAFQKNVRYLSRRSGGRPVLAVVKCNGYGVGHQSVGPILDVFSEVAGFAVVTAEEALELREAGVRKPILLMDDFAESMAGDLAAHDITLAAYTRGINKRLTAVAKKVDRPIEIHPYLDTGFHRMGMDYRRAESWIEELAHNPAIRITGTFTELTEEVDFDREQIKRFKHLTEKLRQRGVELGRLHAVASHGITHHPDAFFDMVRPGNMVYGILPDDTAVEDVDIRVAYRMKARVIRIVPLHKGESTGYNRAYFADQDTDIAIVKCGRTDGYVYRTGGKGTHVLIKGRLYPVVAGVSGSHCFVDLGRRHGVRLRDIVTMLGPEPGVRPYQLADTLGLGRYEGFNISSRLPKYVVA
ncbi:MAG: alanine racemase [Acidobacteriota bacterium]